MRNKGFTLIELIVVIVILGVIGAIAAPRFLGLQEDAKSASIIGLNASLKSGADIVYGKASIEGLESLPEARIDFDSNNTRFINVAYGFPKATLEDLNFVVSGLASDWAHKTLNTELTIYFGYANYAELCVKYTQATESRAAIVQVIDNKTECGGLSQ
ncbi:prepilin-type N-terminal cleavage/methylation domain-containing protein [Vibrio campbellii]|uniref:prepilin-type N-terminal cleavage/methylation domain-containing protein n=1 Tax=Vibrio campbellii TaxID=680 RepID=UPI00015440DD|nr:msha pilin protein msha [Vibrio campbellii HY01]